MNDDEMIASNKFPLSSNATTPSVTKSSPLPTGPIDSDRISPTPLEIHNTACG